MAPITFIYVPPRCITINEHRQILASTPESFNEIPPVLHHKEENSSITLEPQLQGFAEEDCASGTLYIIESALFFLSVTGKGIRIEYPTITLHAIAREDSFPKVYCQLSDNDQEEEISEDNYMRELNIIPRNPSSVEVIFEALSACAALHPDPQEDEEESDGAFLDANEDTYENGFEPFVGEEEQLSSAGRATLQHLESVLEISQSLETTTAEIPQRGETNCNSNGLDK